MKSLITTFFLLIMFSVSGQTSQKIYDIIEAVSADRVQRDRTG